MIGRFVTTKYASRDDFEAGLCAERTVAYNSFTLEGLTVISAILAGTSDDSLAAGSLTVGDGAVAVELTDTKLSGKKVATASLDEGYPLHAPAAENPRGYSMFFRATFGEDEANFDWLERGILTQQGVLVDRSVEDQGRKAPGTVWTIEAQIEWAA